MRSLPPEQIELEKKSALLERLKDRLADREEEMADLRGELERFEARYTMDVARLYAELDEIEARIAEEEVKLVPDDEEIKKKAEELRRLAEESAARAAESDGVSNFRWDPTPEAKRAYHDLARIIHPDLALDETEKERRHVLMSELNDAYSAGDQGKLNKLVEDYRNSPDLISGDSIGDRLVRTIRQIFQVKRRMTELTDERNDAQGTELFELKEKVKAELLEGRDLLRHMAERTKTHIGKAQRRLANLENVNAAAEDYVKERFGMDISDFRKK